MGELKDIWLLLQVDSEGLRVKLALRNNIRARLLHAEVSRVIHKFERHIELAIADEVIDGHAQRFSHAVKNLSSVVEHMVSLSLIKVDTLGHHL